MYRDRKILFGRGDNYNRYILLYCVRSCDISFLDVIKCFTFYLFQFTERIVFYIKDISI